MRDKRGFTLIELIAVIAILSIIILLVVPNITNIAGNSKESLRESKIKTIETAASNYGNDLINDYQNCLGSTSSNELKNKCTVSISKLINNGYMDGENDTDGIIDPVTNEALTGNILLCYNPANVSVYASYVEGDSYSCKDIAVSGENTLNLNSIGGTGYIGGSPITVNIIKSGNFVSFSCSSSNEDLASCNINSGNSALTITPASTYDSALSDGEEVEITLRGNYTSGGKNYTLSKTYTLKLYDTDFTIDESENNVCMLSGTTKTVQINGLNIGTVSVTSSDKDILDGTFKDNVLYVTGGNTTGTGKLTIKETNGNNEIELTNYVYKFSSSEIPDNLVINKSANVTLDYSDTGTITVTTDNPNVLSFTSTQNEEASSITLGEGEKSFSIKAKGVGTAKVIIKGSNCGEIIKEITVSNLSLKEHSGTVYLGGENFKTEIILDGSSHTLQCSSNKPESASCLINGTTLEVVPQSVESDDVRISVSSDDGGIDSITVKVLPTSVQIVDGNGNEVSTVCNEKNSSNVISTLNVTGKNMGLLTVKDIENWYLAEATLSGNALTVEKRSVVSGEEPIGYNPGFNTGRTRIEVRENNGNKIASFNYYIYSLELSGSSGTVNVGKSLSFDATISATGEITATSSDPSIASVTVENSNRYREGINLSLKKTIVVTGNSVGTATITIKGEFCGTKTYIVNVKGNTFSLNLEKGSYTNSIGQNNVSCTTTGSSKSCQVIMPEIYTSSEFEVVGWSTVKDSKVSVYAPGARVTLTQENSGTTFYGNSTDTTKPVCTFTNNLSSISIGTTSYLTLKCTDAGSDIRESQNLSATDFTISNPSVAKITSVSSPSRVSDGYSYVISLESLAFGNFDITFKENRVFNNCYLGNPKITTNNIISAEYTPEEIYYIGKDNSEDVVAVLYNNKYISGDDKTYTLKLYGNGDMLDFTMSTDTGGNWFYAPWYSEYRNKITDVYIGNGITNIGPYAFYQMNSLKNVLLGEDIEYIGDYAFYDSSLTDIDLNGLTKLDIIGDYAFMNSNLESVNFSSSLSEIGEYAFSNTNVTTVNFSEEASIKVIGNSAFRDNQYLNSFEVPSSLENLGNYSLSNCNNLTDVSFSKNTRLLTIGEGAFEYDLYLTSLDLPESLVSIGDYAFRGSGLENIELYANVSNLSGNAFDETYNLKSINVQGNANYYSLDGILYNGNTLIKCPSNYQNEIITIAEGTLELGENAFTNSLDMARNAKKVTVNLPSTIQELNLDTNFNNFQVKEFIVSNNPSYTSKDGVLYSSDMKTLLKVPTMLDTSEITIESTIETINSYAFYKVQNIKNVKIMVNVLNIGDYAFYTNDIENGIDEIELNSQNNLVLGSYALDIYDIEANNDSDKVRYIYVSDDALASTLRNLEYIDDIHIKVIKKS